MSIKITEPPRARGLLTLADELTTQNITISQADQHELLESLARILGYTLVDREERKSLLALTEEVDEDENSYQLSEGWRVWQDRAEALAAAVNQLFDTREA